MLRKSKILSLLLCFCLLFEQSGFAQMAGALSISGHISAFGNSFVQDKFRPLHLRSLGYDNNQNNLRLLIDKGDLKNPKQSELESTAKILLNYFFVGIILPNDAFWVNLKPDSENNIIDPDLATTDVGKILLEADLQLKKDTAKFTSPETPQGKEYWDKLYQKAGELLGYENISIPTLTRPWIVPGEIIIRETKDNAYIYKATLKVMLEQDYLKDSATYKFDDPRLKILNEYSSQLVRDLIIPKLTKEINISERYAPLRQVYYSLILAQWFKSRFYGKGGSYSQLIDRKNLQGLTSKISWSKTTYFQAYQKSFKDGEYKIQQPVYTPYGQMVRSYFSGGFVCNVSIPAVPAPGVATERTEGPTKVTVISGGTGHITLPQTDTVIVALAVGGNTIDPSNTQLTIQEGAPSLPDLAAGGLQLEAFSVPSITQAQLDDFSYPPDIADEGQILFELENNHNISPVRKVALLKKLDDIHSQEKRNVSFGSDFVIAGDNLGGVDGKAHEDYHREGEFAEVISQIADEIGATLRSDLRFDLRSVVENSPGKRIATSHGEIYLTEDGVLVIGDSRFQRDHAGRGELAVYARSRAKVQHELSELRGWIQFAVKKGLAREHQILNRQVDLGQILRNYMNGSSENLTPAQLASRRQQVLLQRDQLHQEGLEAEREVQQGQSLEHKKFAIIIYADRSTDWNGALENLVELREELEARGYTVRPTRVDSVESLIEKVEFYSAERAPDLLIIGAHGTQESMHLGNGYDGVLTLRSMNKLSRIRSKLANGGTIVLISCSTARGEAFENNMANAFSENFPQAEHIFAPRVSSAPRFIFDTKNEVSGIDYQNRELGPVSSVNFITGKTNLTEIGYDAVAAKRISRLVVETLDQADMDFIISSNEIPFVSTSSSTEKIKVEEIVDSMNPVLSLPLAPVSLDRKGGIDFRTLPIVNQQINMGALKLSSKDLKRLNNVNLDSEWVQIQNMVNAGIIPSNERIKEYVLASCLRQNLGNQINKVLGCIADIMRMEEDRVLDSEPGLKNMLVLLESCQPANRVVNDLSNISFTPEEPELVI